MINQKLITQLSKEKSMLHATWGTISILVPLFIIIIITPAIYSKYALLGLLLLAPLLGTYIYKLTIIMHDCCHNTFFPSKKLNKIVGNICSAMVFSNFDAFSKTHWKHHSKYGEIEDPQKEDYLNLTSANKKKIIWHLIRPLVGYNFFKIFLFQNQGSTKSNSSKNNNISSISYSLLAQIIITTTITNGYEYLELILFYPVCAITFGLFFSQIRGFCEHISFPHKTPEKHVRTHLPNFIDRLFFYDLNFNYHVEHHLYPQVPSYHLQKIHKILKNDFHKAETLSKSISKTILTRIKQAPS